MQIFSLDDLSGGFVDLETGEVHGQQDSNNEDDDDGESSDATGSGWIINEFLLNFLKKTRYFYLKKLCDVCMFVQLVDLTFFYCRATEEGTQFENSTPTSYVYLIQWNCWEVNCGLFAQMNSTKI